MDGHVSIGSRFIDFARKLVRSDASFAVLRHRDRGSVVDELVRCVANDKLTASELADFLRLGLDLTHRSVECGFIYRNHSSPEIRRQGNRWFDLFCTVVGRDQLLVHHSFDNIDGTMTIIEDNFNSGSNVLFVGNHKHAFYKNVISRLKRACRVMRTGFSL